jgi:hypothetical protein
MAERFLAETIPKFYLQARAEGRQHAAEVCHFLLRRGQLEGDRLCIWSEVMKENLRGYLGCVDGCCGE